MNGPRLQASTVEGWEEIGGITQVAAFGDGHIHWSSVNDIDHTNLQRSDIALADTFNGRQKLIQLYWPESNGNTDMYSVREKMAFKTNIPDIYLIVTVFRTSAIFLGYVHVGSYPIYPARADVPARTLVVTLPRSIWKRNDSSIADPTTLGRTTTNVYLNFNQGFNPDYSFAGSRASDAANWDGFPTQGGAITKAVDANNITYTVEFPATYNSMRVCAIGNIWDIVPNFMQGRKMGNVADRVLGNLTSGSGHAVAKVYSPQKGCLCLKSLTNGEIPIMNE